MTVGRRTARTLAWLALAGQVAFIAAWVVVGALEPDYDHLEHYVSELGADDADNPLVVNAAIVVFGVSFALLGPALLAVLRRRPAAVVTAAVFVAAGLAVSAGGPLQLDCAMSSDRRCEDLWRAGELSWQHDAHLWVGIVAQLLLAATPFALARALWASPAGAAALTAGVAGFLGGLILFFLPWSDDIAGGLTQRLGLGLVHLWVLIVTGGILYATRLERPPGPLVPLRPRDFFARAWVGEGELLLRPFFLGRRAAQRFPVRRQSTWISDRVWRFDDEGRFGGGPFRRQMFCELVADDHVHVTAADLPEGADVSIEEGGLRFHPFRMAFPIGPVPILMRCRDHSYLDSDGTFVNVIDAHTPLLDIPFARTTFRVRPEDGGRNGEGTASIGDAHKAARPEPTRAA